MAKGKKKSAGNSASTPQAVASRAAQLQNPVPRMTVSTRNFVQLIPSTELLTQAATSSDSFLGVGSQYVNVSKSYSLREFISSTSGVPIVYDQYRIDTISVYATVDAWSPPYSPTYVTSSVDYDDTNVESWVSMSQRSNTKVQTLTVQQPTKLLATFHPVPNFDVAPAGSSPSNVVPSKNTWFDLANTSQTWNGIKLSVASQQNASVRIYALASIDFRGKI